MKEIIKELRENIYDCGLDSNLQGHNFYSINEAIATLDKLEKAINNTGCSLELPSKEEVKSEGEKQIIDWLEGNTDREKKHYRVAFRRSFEYVLRRLRK